MICTGFQPFLAVFAHLHFLFRPLLTTIFRVSRKRLWWLLWSWDEPRRNVRRGSTGICGSMVTLFDSFVNLFLRRDTARRAMPNQRLVPREISFEKEALYAWRFWLNEHTRRIGARCHNRVHHKRDPRRDDGHGGHIWHWDHKQGSLQQSSLPLCLHLR